MPLSEVKIITALTRAFLYACLLANVNAKVELSLCLTTPIQGLVYRYTGALEGSVEMKAGCYVKYGNGRPHHAYAFHPERIHQRKYFVIDSRGNEKFISADGHVNASIIDRRQSTVEAEPKMRIITSDHLCFPEPCYESRLDYYRSCTGRFPCDTKTTSTYFMGKVKYYDSQIFCSSVDARVQPGESMDLVAFHPFEEARVTHLDRPVHDLEPYILYVYGGGVIPGGVSFGCQIWQPLNSDTSFRTFSYFVAGKGMKPIDVSSLVSKCLGEKCMVPKSLPFQEFCFPENCYRPNETQHCGDKAGLDPDGTGSGIVLKGKDGQWTILLEKIPAKEQCNL